MFHRTTTSTSWGSIIRAYDRSIPTQIIRPASGRPESRPTLELDKKIDLQLLYHCTSFFETPSDFNSRRVSKQSPPTSRYTALPIELQLEVLDKMSIHEADDAVRQNFPHLIPCWIESVPQRFERWLNDLTSLKNLRHLGCINYPGFSRDDQTVPLSLYRLQSIDFHPSTEIGPSTLISPPPSQDSKAEWKDDVDKFFKIGLLALLDGFLGSDGDLTRILRNKRDPDCGCYGSRPCRRCPGVSHSDIYAMALSRDPSKPTKANPTPPYLLLYRDELVEIYNRSKSLPDRDVLETNCGPPCTKWPT